MKIFPNATSEWPARRVRRACILTALPLCLGFAAAGWAAGATPTVFATGLLSPSKIIATPGGSLLVAEAGQDPNTGRISILDSSGGRKTLIDGLPSGLAAPDMSTDGPNGIALSGNVLFVNVGEGDSFRNGPTPGTIVPNPAGPSSPLFASVLQITFSADPATLASGFTLASADQFTLVDGDTVTLTNSTGDTAAITLLADFRSIPDAHAIYRNSHPYGMTLLATQPDYLYVTDAGMNTVLQIDLSTGRHQVLARFPNTQNPTKQPPPFSEAVPTSVHPHGHKLLVSLLSGAPFVPGQSRIVEVDPATGNTTPFIALLSSAIDVLYRGGSSVGDQFFVLEYSGNLTQGAPGDLRYYTLKSREVLASGLNTPSSMAIDETSGSIFITDRGDGTVLRIPLP